MPVMIPKKPDKKKVMRVHTHTKPSSLARWLPLIPIVMPMNTTVVTKEANVAIHKPERRWKRASATSSRTLAAPPQRTGKKNRP